MIICDFCEQAITEDAISANIAPNPMGTGNVHVDLHRECVSPWAGELKKIKGQKPPKS